MSRLISLIIFTTAMMSLASCSSKQQNSETKAYVTDNQLAIAKAERRLEKIKKFEANKKYIIISDQKVPKTDPKSVAYLASLKASKKKAKELNFYTKHYYHRYVRCFGDRVYSPNDPSIRANFEPQKIMETLGMMFIVAPKQRYILRDCAMHPVSKFIESILNLGVKKTQSQN